MEGDAPEDVRVVPLFFALRKKQSLRYCLFLYLLRHGRVSGRFDYISMPQPNAEATAQKKGTGARERNIFVKNIAPLTNIKGYVLFAYAPGQRARASWWRKPGPLRFFAQASGDRESLLTHHLAVWGIALVESEEHCRTAPRRRASGAHGVGAHGFGPVIRRTIGAHGMGAHGTGMGAHGAASV